MDVYVNVTPKSYIEAGVPGQEALDSCRLRPAGLYSGTYPVKFLGRLSATKDVQRYQYINHTKSKVSIGATISQTSI